MGCNFKPFDKTRFCFYYHFFSMIVANAVINKWFCARPKYRQFFAKRKRLNQQFHCLRNGCAVTTESEKWEMKWIDRALKWDSLHLNACMHERIGNWTIWKIDVENDLALKKPQIVLRSLTYLYRVVMLIMKYTFIDTRFICERFTAATIGRVELQRIKYHFLRI